jgi:carboxynorspermidine decarboxylase
VHEARLGSEEFGKETHVFSPSYTEENIGEYIRYADHLVFNSFSQWNRFKETVKNSGKKVSCGIRVNPEHCETEVPMYDPCGPFSHFGVTLENFEPQNLEGLEGLHFHNLCELNADSLQRTLVVVEEKFGQYLPQMKWINFGGGHHITRRDYDIELLCRIIADFKSRYPHLEVYLEPGEAIALNSGVLVASVVDIFKNGVNIAVLDVSATTHMPDVLEMPYRPTILGVDPAHPQGTGENVYRLVGPTCLTGDVIGHYTFPEPLAIGQKLIFMNMAIYTMVKNTTFNGVNLPSIALMDAEGKIEVIKRFGYEDFKGRLS